MPSLGEFVGMMRQCAEQHGVSLPEQYLSEIQDRARSTWPGERIYLIPKNGRRDPERSVKIVELSRHSPCAVISDRLGISRQLVAYHLKKNKGIGRKP